VIIFQTVRPDAENQAGKPILFSFRVRAHKERFLHSKPVITRSSSSECSTDIPAYIAGSPSQGKKQVRRLDLLPVPA
jgi:hypothetical protein